jgi:hypothetical protein
MRYMRYVIWGICMGPWGKSDRSKSVRSKSDRRKSVRSKSDRSKSDRIKSEVNRLEVSRIEVRYLGAGSMGMARAESPGQAPMMSSAYATSVWLKSPTLIMVYDIEV